MNKKIISLEVFGWYGMFAILVAYALVSFDILPSDNLWFQILNLTGALGLTTISFYKKAYQLAVLNAVWTIIAMIAIIKILL